MGHTDGASRAPHLRFPEVLDEYMAEENPARFLDAVVDSLALGALGFQRPRPAATGRPAYDPGALLKRYSYGYMNRIRASRRLARETSRHVERRWLLRTLRPAFNPMAAFRKATGTAFTQVFRPFARRCKEWGPFGQALGASDGSNVNAVNDKRGNVTQARRREPLQGIDADIDHYRREGDMPAVEEAPIPHPTAAAWQEKGRQPRERNGRDEGLLQEVGSTGQRQVSFARPRPPSTAEAPRSGCRLQCTSGG